MSRLQKLTEKAAELAPQVDEEFMKLGETLSRIQDIDAGEFKDVISKIGIGQRKAYYLVDVYKAFSVLKIAPSKVKKIGWTKLSLLAPHITPSNADQLLKAAESNSAKNLTLILRGEEPLDQPHCLLLYLDPDDFDSVVQALKLYGAFQGPRHLQDKEKALVAMAEDVLSKTKQRGSDLSTVE